MKTEPRITKASGVLTRIPIRYPEKNILPHIVLADLTEGGVIGGPASHFSKSKLHKTLTYYLYNLPKYRHFTVKIQLDTNCNKNFHFSDDNLK